MQISYKSQKKRILPVLFFFQGHIPLRQLVYRVHPLPESMKPLVWDFGQLNEFTEQAYARQIIMRYVSF